MPPVQVKYIPKPEFTAKDLFQHKSAAGEQKRITFLCISAHNPTVNKEEVIKKVATAIAKKLYEQIVFIESGYLYRHTEKVKLLVKKILKGIKAELSEQELAKIIADSLKLDIDIATKCIKAAIDARLPQSGIYKSGIQKKGYNFVRARDSRQEVPSNQPAAANVEILVGELKALLKNQGLHSEAEKVEKIDGPYPIYKKPIVGTATPNEVKQAIQQLQIKESELLRQRIPTLKQGDFFVEFPKLASSKEKLCFFSQWANVIGRTEDKKGEQEKFNETLTAYISALELELKNNKDAGAAFQMLLKVHVDKLVEKELKNHKEIDSALLQEAITKHERNFIIEELAGLLACLEMAEKMGCTPTILYPFGASELGKPIFDFLNKLHHGPIEWIDISSTLEHDVSPLPPPLTPDPYSPEPDKMLARDLSLLEPFELPVSARSLTLFGNTTIDQSQTIAALNADAAPKPR